MPRYKRTRDEAELDLVKDEPANPATRDALAKLRNTWEFASVMQYINLFGNALKIDDDFDIEDLEAECLRSPPSDRLPEIGLAFLKHVSSHRGLNLEIFAEYTRRQYLAKAPQRNPFGDEEQPIQFNDLDVSTRLQILHQLSNWTIGNPERFRGMMPEDEDDLTWRMEPLGWDKEDRTYFVLDDNRLYRRTDPPIPTHIPSSKGKRRSTVRGRARATRATKRRKVTNSSDDELSSVDTDVLEGDISTMPGDDTERGEVQNSLGFTDGSWECIAVSLEDYQEFMATLFRSRDPNEKQLRSILEADVMPIIEKRAESIRQKKLKKFRELENLQRMSTAKRSSRLADKADREKQEREEREAEEKRQRDLEMALEEQERQKKIKEGHESRRLTREQRLRERETKRILHEEELLKLEEAQSADDGTDGLSKRMSERQLKTQSEMHKQELEKLAEEEGMWIFDCSVCGLHGENYDDGTHSMACDRCNVWQHSKCHGITPKQAEREDFHFVCSTCMDKEEEAQSHAQSLGHVRAPDDVSLPDEKTAIVETRSPHEQPPDRTSGEESLPSSGTNGIDPSNHRHAHDSAHHEALVSSRGHPANMLQPASAIAPDVISSHSLNGSSVQNEVHGRMPHIQQTPQKLGQSPKTNFPPPAQDFLQHGGYSPVKSSPPPHSQHHERTYLQQSPSHETPRLTYSTPQLMSLSAKGQRTALDAAQHSPHVRPLSSASSNGMSGPWPEGSSAIPVKQSQSPVPLAKSSFNDVRIVPPVAALALNPRPTTHPDPAEVIPVKKLQNPTV